ncbi:MAG: hypothetical protein ACRENI_01770, partial [Gemmatimonadaceae bacterium]
LQQEESGRKNATSNEARHSDLEFTLLETRWHLNADLRELYSKAACCALDSNADPDHRIQAAKWACIFAENICEPTAAKDIYGAVQPVRDAASVEHSLHLDLIFNTSFGDLDLGVEAATAYLACVKDRNADAQTVGVALRHAAVAFRYAGFSADAAKFLREAYEFSNRHGLVADAHSAAVQLTWIFLDTEDIDGAAAWHSLAVRQNVAGEELQFRAGHDEAAVRVALARGENDLALRLAEQELSATSDLSYRSRIAALAIYVRAAAAHGTPIADRFIRELEALQRQARGVNGQAYPAYSLYIAYDLIGRRPEGLALLKEYVHKYRRDRVPLSAEIIATLASSPMDAHDTGAR